MTWENYSFDVRPRIEKFLTKSPRILLDQWQRKPYGILAGQLAVKFASERTSMSDISYHWEIETVDEDGDIVCRNFLDELRSLNLRSDEHLSLARCDWHKAGYVKQWAYVVDGKLPERFCYIDGGMGCLVPKWFREELGRTSLQCV